MTYFVAGCFSHGMNMEEIYNLTMAIVEHGSKLELKKKIILDKHCLPYETPILIRDDQKIAFTNIGDLVENHVSLNKNLQVLSWDNNFNVCSNSKFAIWCNDVYVIYCK